MTGPTVHRYAIYFLAFCLGVLFTVICQGALT